MCVRVYLGGHALGRLLLVGAARMTTRKTMGWIWARPPLRPPPEWALLTPTLPLTPHEYLLRRHHQMVRCRWSRAPALRVSPPPPRMHLLLRSQHPVTVAGASAVEAARPVAGQAPRDPVLQSGARVLTVVAPTPKLAPSTLRSRWESRATSGGGLPVAWPMLSPRWTQRSERRRAPPCLRPCPQQLACPGLM